jgi:hypothetical protein
MSVSLLITYQNGETEAVLVSSQPFWRNNFTALANELGLGLTAQIGAGYVAINHEESSSVIKSELAIMLDYLATKISTGGGNADTLKLKEKIELQIVPYLDMYQNPEVVDISIS